MEKMHTNKKNLDCTICKVYFDNWISTHDYDGEHERRVRSNFCRYCKCCDSCKRRR